MRRPAAGRRAHQTIPQGTDGERGGNYFWKYKNATTPTALDYFMPHNEEEMARILLASEDL